MNADEPSYLAFARANVRQGLPSGPILVRELVDRIDRDATTLKAVRPRIITAVEQLDALPFETVIRDAEGHVLERWGEPSENLWATVMVSAYIPRGDIALPATVLFTPEAAA